MTKDFPTMQNIEIIAKTNLNLDTQGIPKPFHIEIIAKKANPLQYDLRDGSLKINRQIREIEAQFLTDKFPQHKIIILNQVHGSEIVLVNRSLWQQKNKNSLVWADADASITNDPSFLLTVVTADCLPIFIIKPGSAIKAAIHAGWQGTQKKITELTVEKLIKEYSISANDLTAFILPGISSTVYEVGEEVAKIFPEHSTPQKDKKNKYLLDLKSANHRQLLNAGIPENNIYATKQCTYLDNDILFSHRKKDLGRNLNIIYQ